MITKILLPILSIILNLEVVANTSQEIDRLNTLIAILSISLITILSLLTINLVKMYRLKAKNKHVNNL